MDIALMCYSIINISISTARKTVLSRPIQGSITYNLLNALYHLHSYTNSA